MKKYPKLISFLAAVIALPSFLSPAVVSAATLSAPSLTSPSNNQTLTNYPRTATFRWSSVSGADRYVLEIACDVCVSKTNKWQGAKQYTVNGTSYTVKVPGADNQFRWRVRAYDGSIAGNWSSFRYFKYNTKKSSTVAAPSIHSPAEDQVLTSRSVNFSWSAISGASSYEVNLQYLSGSNWYNQGDFTTLLTHSNYTLNYDRNYRLRVRAITNGNTYNKYGNWSNWREFVMDADNSNDVGTPAIISPSDESHISSNYVNLDWSTVTDATSYEYQVTRLDGSNWITIANSTVTASDAAVYLTSGNYGQYSFRVRAIKNGSYGNWSDYNQFYYDNSGGYYGAPIINTPYEDQTFTNRSVSIGWSSVSGASSYEINVNYKVDGYWTNQDTYTAYTNPYSLTFYNDNDYRVRVRAKFSGSSYGSWSDWREFTVDGDSNNYGSPAIYAPTESQVLTNRDVYMNWSSVSGASSYEVNVMYVSGSNWVEQGTYTTSQNTYNLYLYNDNNYRIRVRAKFSDYTYGNWTDWRDFTVDADNGGSSSAPVIYNPTENALVQNTTRQISLNWQSISGASEYIIEMLRDGYSTETLYPGSNTYYTFTTSANDAWYHFRVRARLNGGSYTDWSGYRYFHYVYSGSSGYAAPTINNPTEDQIFTNRNVSMNWSSVSGASSYEVNVMYVSGSNWVDQGTYTTNYNSYSLYFSYDNYYRIRVRARLSDYSYGNWSDWREFRMYADFGNTNGSPYIYSPTENQALNQSSRNINLAWNSVNNASYYEIQTSCDTCGGGSTEWQYTNNYTTYSTSYLWYAPGSDNMLRFKVRAYKTDSTYTPWSDWRTFHYYQTN